MLQYKLENQLRNLIRETGRDPKIIVMHPQTWIDLAKEVNDKFGMAINRYDPNLRYRGIKVLRSWDLGFVGR